MLYRGYVPIRGKKCIMPFKDKSSDELLTIEQARVYDEYAGILADDVVVIDVDDQEQSEILMDIVEEKGLVCKVVETTRGKHFYFKNNGITKNGTNLRLAIGLTADIKIGANNSYVVLKKDGIERKVIYDKFDDEEYQTIPKWLTPVKSKIEFLELDDGDGRNDAFFRYILVLQSAEFNRSEIRECFGIINEHIVKESLPEDELETILRSESFGKESFFNGPNFLFDKFANYLKSNNSIIKINGRLHIYRGGVYVQGYSFIEQEMIRKIPRLNRSKRLEVIDYLELIAPETKTSSENYIAFNNGIYDLVTGEMIPFSSDIIITNKIPHNYNPNAYNEVTDKAIDRMMCGDNELRNVLLESLGYCFYRNNILRKSFVLIGNRRNGKSTWFDLVAAVLGIDNISALDVKEIGDRFRTAEMFGKLANIGDDIDDDYIPSTGVFKKAVAGGRITVEKKGKDPFEFNPYCTVLLSCNNMPRMKDKTGAVLDRLVMIPFDRTFSETDPDYDPFIKFKLIKEDSLEYLIRLGIEHLKVVLKQNQFTIPEKVMKQNEEYDIINNPIKSFFQTEDLDGQVTKDSYVKYQLFCADGGYTPITQIEFSRQVCRHFNYTVVNKKIDGKKYRVFAPNTP